MSALTDLDHIIKEIEGLDIQYKFKRVYQD